MNGQFPGRPVANSAASGPRRPIGVHIVSVVLALEALLLWSVTAWFIRKLLTETPTSLAGAFALLALSALAAVWVSLITVNIHRRRSWTRGGALTWQLVQIMVALGAFQGVYARPDIGWGLLAPSVLVIVLLFTKPVVAATNQVELYPDDPNDRV